MIDFSNYQSPYSWRYGSPEMRSIWSEENKRQLWRKLWVWLAQAEHEFGLVKADQLDDLRQHVNQINISRSLEIEKDIRHDLMAELQTFAEQCPVGGKIIHAGATSMDIKDNAEALQCQYSLDLILNKLKDLINRFCGKIIEWADIPCLAFTHLQPAEVTTLGYRFSIYGTDLLSDYENLISTRHKLKGKGFKGAVGTAASYIELIGADKFSNFEGRLSELVGLPFYTATAQTYPRKQDYEVISCLAGLGLSLSKFSFDLRIMQSLPFGEWAEPFHKAQVGSSAMPFKRNPIKAEMISSLARSLASMPQIAWHNAATSFLERTMDDSANRRTMIPESFLICDEMLITALDIIEGIEINPAAISQNLDKYIPFANTEKLLMILVKAGADRQEIHEILRQHAMKAWQSTIETRHLELSTRIYSDPIIQKYLSREEISTILQSKEYFGIASEQAKITATHILDRVY